MGLVFGVPFTVFITELFSEPLKIIKTIVTFWWLKILYRNRRLDVFDPADTKDLAKLSMLISDPEKRLESPEADLRAHTTDSILIFGANSSGECLIAKICREQEGNVGWLLLEMSDGQAYQLPNPERSYPFNTGFVAGGLTIKCNTPMRRWRVSYNGVLRRVTRNEENSQYLHVKFSFTCISTSFVYDAYEDIRPEVMLPYLTSEKSIPWIPKNKKVTKYLNRYIQPTCVLGTVTVEGADETELNLYGIKHRSRDTHTCNRTSSLNFKEVLVFTKDGQMVYSGNIKPPGFTSNFQYGHFMERCGLSWPVIQCKAFFSNEENGFSGAKVDVKTVRSFTSVEVDSPKSSFICPAGLSTNQVTRIHLSAARTLDGDTGHALTMEHDWNYRSPGTAAKLEGPLWKLPKIDGTGNQEEQLVIPLSNVNCQTTSLTGGKGSSLATLTQLSTNYKTNFKVPLGFVVTTTAYKEFFNKSGIKNIISQFEKDVLSAGTDKRNEICQNLVNQLSKAKLPSSVEDAIRRQHLEIFSDHEMKKRFAVRSSASGEDSEELSAAGQMSTLLGVQGVENILQAVVKCWSSQFSFTAVEYKRQNGQEINSMMAVVIQEMVPADIAGVLFTCDPVTGHPQILTITANYGIGESVVSASADPDTVVLQRDIFNRVAVKSVQIGKKKTKVVMADGGNVEEKTNTGNHSSVCCISSENSKLLAETCLKIEEAYGFSVDIEWAFKDNKLFMLQARPVTTFDKETKYEVAHSTDNGFRAEDEYNTKANVGEVMVDAFSPLGNTFLGQIVAYMFYELYNHRNPTCFPFNPFERAIPFSQFQAFINMSIFVLRFYKKGKQSFLSESNIISGFGRILEDKEIYEQADRRNKSCPPTFLPYQLIFFIDDLLFADVRLKKATERFWKEEIDLSQCKNSKEMYLHIFRRTVDTIYASSRHMDNTLNSSIYNSLVMGILGNANKGWGATVYSDFAKILSSCGNVVSADIPHSVELLLKDISKAIDASKFKEMEKQDALQWLETTPSSAGVRFRDFIKKHGHRCLKEFDIYSKPWGTDTLPLVQILQDSVGQANVSEKKRTTTSEIIESLEVPLNWKEKLLLKFLIPLCRRAVCNRETGKSLMIKHYDFARKGFWTLAEQMVKEGRLPDKDLLFFLTEYELLELMETRSPSLVQKAVRRRQIYPELDKLRFPEITKGIPKPVNAKKYEDFSDFQSNLEIKGVPVSQGVVKGRARVALNLKEAYAIQKGEILIAYCTDIAWSPYFPLLSGVATELGGLISHGAVVAREYGLPCVVGVFDATCKFKTGDLVLLDGNRGILKRLEPAETKA